MEQRVENIPKIHYWRMEIRKLITILLLAFCFTAAGQGGQIEIWTKKSATDSQHALLHLPSDYNSTPSTKRYPLILFAPGLIEGVGTDLAEIYTNSTAGGPAYEIAQGSNMTFTNPVTGLTEKFIVVSIQSTQLSGTTSAQMPYILADLFAKYPKIDTGRITLTCISQGGHPTSEYAGGTIGTPAYRIAGYIPMSAALTGSLSSSQGAFMYNRGTGIWGFGDVAETHGANTGALVYYYNVADPLNKGHFTATPGTGHSGWNINYDPDRRETVNGYNVNVYEWALMQGTPTIVGGGGNTPPVADAGADRSIALPTNSLTMAGDGADGDGTVTTYAWSKISGPETFTITNPALKNTTITGLVQGTYIFRLTVTDNGGSEDTDEVTVNVAADPTVCAGRRITVVKGGDNGKYLSGKTFAVYPGDTLVLKSANNPFSYFSLEDMHGSPSCPIVVINEGGVVNVGAMAVKHCTYMKITGSGSADAYGFYMANVATAAMSVSGRSKNIEIERTSVYNETYMAWVKHEADCQDSLKYPNWYIDSISYHDNKGFRIAQDGLYFGSTSPNGQRNITCNGVVIAPIPLRLSNIKIYNNIIDSCGRTAIQLSGADMGNNSIYNNTVKRAGYELNQTQGQGIASGGMTKVAIYDNYIRQTFQNGIFILGAGLNSVYDNDIDSSGYLGATFNSIGQPCGIYVDTRATTPTTNTTVSLKGNIIGKVATLDGRQVVVKKSHNTFNTDNVICGNITQSGGLAAIYVEPSITYATTGCEEGENIAPLANAGENQVVTLPTSTITLSGSALDSDGAIASYAWSKLSGPGYSIDNATIQAPVLTNLTAGTYVFRLMVLDNDGDSDTDEVTITVNPVPVVNRVILQGKIRFNKVD